MAWAKNLKPVKSFFLAMPLALQYHDTSPKPAMISVGT